MFLKPEKNITLLKLQEGMSVADFGSGTGFYTMEAAKKVGTTGHVYSIEIQKDILKKLEDEIKDSGFSNIECIWGNVEKNNGTKLASNSMDAVIISNVLFQNEDRLGVIDEAKRILKKDGKILFVDLSQPLGGSDKKSNYIISPQEAENLFSRRGFKIIEKIITSPHHYVIIFQYE